MLFSCCAHPLSFMRNASRQRWLGSLSNPDSVTRNSVPPRNFLEAELHQRAWFLRVVHGRVDGIGMPGIGKEGLGLQFLDNGLKPGVLEAWKCDLAARDLACHKRAVELYAKPFAKLPIIRQRAPNSGNGRLEFDFLFDSRFDLWFRLRLRPRSINRQPPSCILFRPGQMRNLFVA